LQEDLISTGQTSVAGPVDDDRTANSIEYLHRKLSVLLPSAQCKPRCTAVQCPPIGSREWRAAAEEAKDESKFNPDIRRPYIDAAVENGCYSPALTPSKQVHLEDGATSEMVALLVGVGRGPGDVGGAEINISRCASPLLP